MASRFFACRLSAHGNCPRYRANPRVLPTFFHRRHLWTKHRNRKMISEIVSPKRSASDRWESARERGTPASLGLIAWVAERVGRPLARLLLFPITIYFLITAHTARRASYEFLKRARNSSVRWWHVLRHFHYFAATILDRVYLLRGEFDQFRVTIHGKEVLQRQMETGKGAILLGSHLGSFEVL